MNSICIATYNGEKYIKEQLNSILSQINEDDEIIISDDGSQDKTLDVIQEIADPRIVLIRNDSKRHGIIGNFQNALKHANGEYIFLSDQDDVWCQEKYLTVLRNLDTKSLVHHDSIVTDEELNKINNSFYSIYHNGKGILKNLAKSTYFGSHMAFHHSLLKYSMPFPPTEEIGHDLWLGLMAEVNHYTVKFIPEKLIYYRRHSDAHCSFLSGSKRNLRMKICGRLIMCYFLLKKISSRYILQRYFL